MMSWFEKRKRSRRRADQEGEMEPVEGSEKREGMSAREALAASVEELTTREKPGAKELAGEDELEEEDEGIEPLSGAALIPPRLRLQSRPLPVVRVAGAKRGLALEQRWAHTAELASAQGKRLGRSTKVRLQAVRPGVVQEPVTERVPVTEADAGEQRGSAQDEQPLVRRVEPPLNSAPSSLFCGNGMIEEGQEDVTIHNQRISAQSVVTVMLAGNPGPVVVHYVSVQPHAGFTLHMSAPVSAPTPFTYAVWLF